MIIAVPPQSGLAGFALRPPRPMDIAEWYAYLSITEVIEHTSWDLHGPEDREELVRRCTAPEPQSATRFAVVEEGRACLAGTIGFHSVSATQRSAQLAYDLALR